MGKNIMLQGTASSVGKSILTAALCRIFKEEGYSVAPFKSQNMALNSFVTEDGKEMGRAQVVQAEAAMVEPMVEMNPILLKPTSDVGSQVIINGEVYKNMTAFEYHHYKKELKQIIQRAYQKLADKYQVIVIEGAGSPAEINLREDDIVNMGMAELVNAPVILIGDIDRGGVFASLYGTVMLMEPPERARIKGFIINKFRGDVKILEPGVKMMEELINIPCLGVIPHMEIKIDDEDSVTRRFAESSSGDIVIGVVKLPYISNFSDFTPLEMEEGVSVRYLFQPDDFNEVDLLIIPGSKNTIKDMEYLHHSVLDVEIYKKRKAKIPIIGICGGFQILGREILDPNGVESTLPRINGLGLLETQTIMLETKQTIQTTGKLLEGLQFSGLTAGEVLKGYEIHMGNTTLLSDTTAVFELVDGRMDGAVSPDGLVFGTYLHGIFENDSFRKGLLSSLRSTKGLDSAKSSLDYKSLKNREYAKLASNVKTHLDMDKLKEIVGLE